MRVSRIIKRMKNKKYYDSSAGKYITLARMAEYAKDEQIEFQVLTHDGDDITNDVLKQILVTLPFTDGELLQLIRS